MTARARTSTRSSPSACRAAAPAPSGTVKAGGLATLRWDSVNGADAYIIVRDGKEITGPIRIEGSNKEWTDKGGK